MVTEIPWHLVNHAFNRSREKSFSTNEKEIHRRQEKEDYQPISLEFLDQFSGDNQVSRFLGGLRLQRNSGYVYGFKLDRIFPEAMHGYLCDKIEQGFATKTGRLDELKDMEKDLEARKNAIQKRVLHNDYVMGIEIYLTPTIYLAATACCKPVDSDDGTYRYFGAMTPLLPMETQFLLSLSYHPQLAEDIVLMFLRTDLLQDPDTSEKVHSPITFLSVPAYDRISWNHTRNRSLYEILVDLDQAPKNFWVFRNEDNQSRALHPFHK